MSVKNAEIDVAGLLSQLTTGRLEEALGAAKQKCREAEHEYRQISLLYRSAQVREGKLVRKTPVRSAPGAEDAAARIDARLALGKCDFETLVQETGLSKKQAKAVLAEHAARMNWIALAGNVWIRRGGQRID
jgi:hypothetical protein